MKKLLNTLYITTQGAWLSREGETVNVSVERETKLRIPIHTLSGIVCFGIVTLTPQLMEMCAENHVNVSFLSEHGKFWAKVQGRVSGNVLLRKEQYRRSDDLLQSAKIARLIVSVKISNCRTSLLRRLRDKKENESLELVEKAVNYLAFLLERLSQMGSNNGGKELNLDSIRGIEGDAARTYFGVFDNLITTQKEAFHFHERSKRPPLDNVNALLSFIYTLLAHDVVSALETVGLDPAVGFLHRDRPGRPGLALDLMEELRPYLADRLALTLVNRQQVKGSGFKKTETGAVLMDDETRKELLVTYQKRKQEEIMHPFIDEKINIGLLPYVQATLFARFLRGDLEDYPPFIWR
ncbi:MAG: hypothetical protein ACD_79C01434G0017 [uncultured bacterium]|nr:MAG: hypothetical protein ACD_79C01434G0017 [uncultured bacterium]